MVSDGNDSDKQVESGGGACGCPAPIDRFTLGQKITVRVCLYGFGATGVVGAFAESWSVGSLVLFVSALAGFVASRCFCSHCPYPRKYDTCYAMPPPLLRAITRHRPGPLSWIEKTLFFLALTVAMLLPQIWLIRRIPLLITYWAFCLPTCFIFPFYICRRCRFSNCPFNQRKEPCRGPKGE